MSSMGIRNLALRFRRSSAMAVQLTAVAVANMGAFALRFDGAPPDWAAAACAQMLPWLLVIPGALAAIWVSSPKRASRYAQAHGGGRIRHGFAHAVAGLSILRSMFVAPPREHGLGLVGTALYWAGDIACLWGALELFGNPRLSVPALIVGYATGYVLTRRSLPAGGPRRPTVRERAAPRRSRPPRHSRPC